MTDEHDKDRKHRLSEHEVPQEGAPCVAPRMETERRRRVLRLVTIGLGTIVGLFVLYFTVVAGGEAEGPTLDARLQQQQRLVDQLRARIDGLQQDRDDLTGEAQHMRKRLESLHERLEAQEDRVQNAARRQLPKTVAALSQRLEALSDSMDARFSVIQTQETKGSVLSSLFTPAPERSDDKASTSRDRKANAKSTSQTTSETRTRRRYTPPSPPFTVSGLEMRGGRRYLTILAGRTGRLTDLHLIGEGQSVGGWRLASIVGHSATFTVNGKIVVVPVP